MFSREINKILIWVISIAGLLFLPSSVAADTWARGNIVGLCKGTEIRTGPGKGYRVHTIVPENDWAVKLIDGPRYADGEEWWDTSRKDAGDPSGGTGWVSKQQATACKTAPPTQPLPTQPSPAQIVLVSGLVLSRSQAVPGEWVNASFRVKNIGGQTFRARYFGVKGRGPGDSDYSFHWIENFTLAPGQEFGYDANRTFERIGSHWFTPNYSVDGSTWADVKWQDGRTSYVTIQIVPPASPTPVPPPPTTRRPPTTIAPPTATLPPTPRATTPAPVTLDYICGYSTAGIIQSGFFLQEGTFYPYIIACSTGEKIGWGPRGGWGQQSYVQINNPVILALSPPVHLNDGTIISREIVRWSDYIRISSCADCGRNNAPPPTTPAPRSTTPAPRPTTPAPEPIITPVPVPPPPPTPGELSIVVAINLSNTTPQVGEKITATFTVRNVGDSPITIRRMVAGARGPNARSAPNNGWSAPNVDFDAVTNLVLSPGETYTYRATRSFSTPGEYFAEPAWLTPTGEWEGIPPYQRVWFTVSAPPTPVPTVCPKANALFVFPLEGRMGWLYRDPRSATSPHDTSTCPDKDSNGNNACHSGLDLWPESSDKERVVRAVYDGYVREVGSSSIILAHDTLGIQTYYAYVKPLEGLYQKPVQRGQAIGNVEGDHLHISIDCVTCPEQDAYNSGKSVIGANVYDPSPYFGMAVDFRRNARQSTYDSNTGNYVEPIGAYCQDIRGATSPIEPADGAQFSSPLTLKWQSVAGAKSYQIQVFSVKFGTVNGTSRIVSSRQARVETVNSPLTILTLSLDPGEYSWHVQAIDENGNGVWSASRRFIVNNQSAKVQLQKTGSIKSGEQKELPATTVSPSQKDLQIRLQWPETVAYKMENTSPASWLAFAGDMHQLEMSIPNQSSAGLELIVFDPRHQRVDANYPHATWMRQSGRIELSVQQPLPGDWSIAVAAQSLPVDEGAFEVLVLTQEPPAALTNSTGVVVLGFTLLLLPIVAGVVIVMATRETSPAVPAAALYRLEGSHAYLQTVLSKPILFLGRDPQGNVRLNDSQVPACAQILCQGNQFILSALDHKNAVLINGKNVKQQWLRDGDRIHIGNTELLFRVKGKVPFRAPTPPMSSAPVMGEAWLSVSRGTQVGTRFILRTPTTRLGRDSSSDIVLEDSQVSRRHAEIRREAKGYVLYDLRSTNGTFVNGKRIASHLLRTGDELGLGQTTLVFQQNIQPRLERS